eukprot:tig00000144_g9079.t1
MPPDRDEDAEFIAANRIQFQQYPPEIAKALARKLRLQQYSTADDLELRSRDDHQIARAYVVAARDLAPSSESVWVFPHLWTWRNRQEAEKHIRAEPDLATGLATALLYEMGVIDEPLPAEEAPGFVMKNLFRIAFQYVLAASSTQHYNFLMSDVATCLEYAGEHREPHLACKIFVDVGAGRAFTVAHLLRAAPRGEPLLRGELTPMPDFSQDEYWEGHYRSTATPFDWYCDWAALRVVFEKHVPRPARILNFGCGNSLQPFLMAREGWSFVQSCDISPTAVSFLAARAAPPGSPEAAAQAGHDFLVADGRRLPYRSRSFDCVFDKGGLDGIFYKEGAPQILRAIWDEARRVLAPGGLLVLVTVGDAHQRLCFVEETLGWTVADVFQVEKDGKAYFVFACTPEAPPPQPA